MSLKNALAGIKEAQAAEPVETTPKRAAKATGPTVKAKQIDLEEHLALTSPGDKPRRERAMGKSRNPDYERMTVYVPTETRKKAERKWEDAGGGDLSDLAEYLLTKYLNA